MEVDGTILDSFLINSRDLTDKILIQKLCLDKELQLRAPFFVNTGKQIIFTCLCIIFIWVEILLQFDFLLVSGTENTLFGL